MHAVLDGLLGEGRLLGLLVHRLVPLLLIHLLMLLLIHLVLQLSVVYNMLVPMIHELLQLPMILLQLREALHQLHQSGLFPNLLHQVQLFHMLSIFPLQIPGYLAHQLAFLVLLLR